MGNAMASPSTTKQTMSATDGRLAYAVSSMQGWRRTMEDTHTALLDLCSGCSGEGVTDVRATAETATNDDASLRATIETKYVAQQKGAFSFFAVFDGHRGIRAADFAARKLHETLVKDRAFHENNIPQAIANAFVTVDKAMRNGSKQATFNIIFTMAHFHLERYSAFLISWVEFESKTHFEPAGCTATVAVLDHNAKILYVGNTGDSRAVLSRSGRAISLSEDHKPDHPEERSRIERGGGFVRDGRVLGTLAVSRGFGDFDFKQADLPPCSQIVTAFPDVMKINLTPDDEFFVLACDGIWECLENQDVVDFVHSKLAHRSKIETICEDLMTECLAEEVGTCQLGCDNMTVVLVGLVDLFSNQTPNSDPLVSPKKKLRSWYRKFIRDEATQTGDDSSEDEIISGPQASRVRTTTSSNAEFDSAVVRDEVTPKQNKRS